MSSELLGSAENALKGNLGGAWDILSGYADAYTDLGIGRKFGGAAAAYSLRDVGAMNGPVVRVRRDSDNSEQDFSALAVPYIPEWCNRQVIKPLDVRELNSGGSGNRDGNFVIAKAAYSLRSLGDRQATIANDAAPLNEDTVVPASGKYVVQVRRNVDGTIKSFTADEVTDGTLASFVNESFTSSLPLDVQGSAAAAYSLRDLKTGGTSVTSSGDTAGDTTSNYVVQVRRSSDDRIKSFTAESITNGDLVTFVTEEQVGWNVQPTWAVSSGDASISSQSSTATTSTVSFSTTSSTSIIRDSSKPNHIVASSGDKVVANITTSGLSGSPVVRLRTSGTNTDVANVSLQSGTNDHTLTLTGDSGYFIYTGLDATSGATITINSVKVIAQSGHVTTWYDQSGNDNHATQGTADSQPKIVNSGSLVTGQTGSNGLDVQKLQFFNLTSDITLANFSSFGVIDNNNSSSSPSGGNNPLLGDNSSNTDFFGIGNDDTDGANNTMSLRTGGSEVTANEGDAGNEGNTVVRTHIYNGSTLTGFANSTQTDNTLSQTGSLSNIDLLFARDSADAEAKTFQGTVSEIIIHSSDQSAKRRAIEESIATANGITLASFSRDGLVRTWYDQSVTDEGGATATGNHAIQATADEQPKVVSDGSLVSLGVDFTDGKSMNFTSISAKTVVAVNQLTSTSGFNYLIGKSPDDDGVRTSSGDGLFSGADTATTGNVDDFNGAGGTTHMNGSQSSFLATSKNVYFGTATSGFALRSLSTAFAPGGTSRAWKGKIAEVILYNSDQTDNRGAFEANIAVHYGITAIPTAADPPTVNGFVETWYDQSGNANNAVQATATKQPKIVNSGSLLTDGILFGANINLPLSGTGLDVLKNVAHGNVFSVLKPLVTGTGNGRYFGASINGGTTARFLFADSQATNASFRIGGRSLDGDSFTDLEGTTTHSNAVSLLTGFINYGTKTATLFLNGSQIDTSTLANMTAGNTSDTSSNNVAIGDFVSSGSNTSDFNAKEIIFFNTDKSSDRADIESNIANHYGITLS
jgi:hypothetical protein